MILGIVCNVKFLLRLIPWQWFVDKIPYSGKLWRALNLAKTTPGGSGKF